MSSELLSRSKSILAELVAYPSISKDGNLALTQALMRHLDEAGVRYWTETDASGRNANLFATIGPDGPGGVILSGHTDVVPVAGQPWSDDPFKLREAEGRLYGRGTCDMKGFVAACIAMAPEFARADLKVPIHFAFTYDEEVGCFGAQALAKSLKARGLRPAAAIIGEPSMMQVIDGHKGCFEYTTWFTGLEGHGSNPDAGVNAVEHAARYVTRLIELREDLKARAPKNCPFDPPFTTINPGLLRGGQAHNVIPGQARLEWEMRPVQPEDAEYVKNALDALITDELLPKMRAVCAASGVQTEIIAEVQGLTRGDHNPARDLVMALTGANTAGLVPFGTEAGIFQSLGIPSVICGPGSIDQAHKPDEFLSVDQLAECLNLLGALQRRLVSAPL